MYFSYGFFINNPATTQIYTLSLHDALPISLDRDAGTKYRVLAFIDDNASKHGRKLEGVTIEDRKSTRLNPSHVEISYAVFCLKKKNHRQRGLHAIEELDHRHQARRDIDLVVYVFLLWLFY